MASFSATVLIVTAQRPVLLTRCLESVERSWASLARDPAAPQVTLQRIVVLNDPADAATRAAISGFPEWEMLETARLTPAAARNRALERARGEWVCFLDDDLEVPANYFATAMASLRARPDTRVLGGCDRTPRDSSASEQALGIALRSPLATSQTRARHGGAATPGVRTADERSLILCNLWIRGDLFEKEGHRFDERFMRNEENVLLHRLRGPGVYFDPALLVDHRRKAALGPLAKAVFRSGWFRALSYQLHPDSARPQFFAPSAFLLYLLILPWALRVSAPIALAPLTAYLVLSVGSSALLAWRARALPLFPLVLGYQVAINLLYGAGFAAGLLAARRALRSPS